MMSGKFLKSHLISCDDEQEINRKPVVTIYCLCYVVAVYT